MRRLRGQHRSRVPALRLAAVLTCALLLGIADLGCAESEPAAEAETVVLLHGLGRTDRAMRPLEERLEEAGFRVHSLRYASTEAPPERLLEDVRRKVDACCADARVLHFVGHSLGAILTRALLAEAPRPNLGRVVMLAPPNRGSELVDALSETALFAWVLGPTAEELGTDPESLPNRLPAPDYEFGVIAGAGTLNPVGSYVLPDEDDGTVSVERTRLDGMTDFLLVSSSHSFIMRSEEVARQVIHFLRHGRFLHAGAAAPEATP